MKNIKLAYQFKKPSLSSLWSCISTSVGLQGWFADDVYEESPTNFIFKWKDYELNVKIVDVVQQKRIKFEWEDGYFLQLELNRQELTKDVLMTITDSLDDDEDPEILIGLWEKHIDSLCRKAGVTKEYI